MIYKQTKTASSTKELNQINQGATYENVRDTIHAIANYLHDINCPHWLVQALSEYRDSKQSSEFERYIAKQQNQYPEPASLPYTIWYKQGALFKTKYDHKLVAPARIATRYEFQSLLEKSNLLLYQGEYIYLTEGIFELGENLCPLPRQYYYKPTTDNQ